MKKRMDKVRASVALASYNGEKYIKEQISSIIMMMGESDELVISDDHSTDNTTKIIQDEMKKESRIRFYTNPDRGLGKNFENAIRHCKGEYIFYSDQDDVWIDDKINKCIRVLNESQCSLVVHDGYYTDCELKRNNNEFGDTIFRNLEMPQSPFRIWIGKGGSTLGCCMAFPKKYIEFITPIPNNDHDVWTINLLSRYGKVIYIYEKLIYHRMHGGNVSVPHRRKLVVVLLSRLLLFGRILKRRIKIKRIQKLPKGSQLNGVSSSIVVKKDENGNKR